MGKKQNKTTQKLSIPIFLICYAIFITLALTVQGILPFEWAISFLPHIFLVNIAFAIFIFFRYKKSLLNTPFMQIVTALFVAATFLLLLRLIDFAFIKPASGIGTREVTIAFFNKYYINTNSAAIDGIIQKINPDIIGFTEFNENELQNYASLQKYPYLEFRYSNDRYSLGIASKYPLRAMQPAILLPHTISFFLTIPTMSTYEVHVAHVPPPVTLAEFVLRNNELGMIGNYVNRTTHNKSIFMGDLNISPWSPTYKQILEVKGAEIKNAAKGQGLFFTWGWVPFIRTHIDHIFVPDSAAVVSFQEESIRGSDHHLIWTKVRL